jgi:phosphatidylserine/phosphatidylglycerophosphate/cardiolipin synthase-like enzyme
MSSVSVRTYCAPTMVLLALDWLDAPAHGDFLGFAITRTGSRSGPYILRNRLTFKGPAVGGDVPSTEAPIQKFMWWDAGVRAESGESYSYTVTPMLGKPGELRALNGSEGSASITLPAHIEDGIGTWFNRAVVSSQAFSALLKRMGVDPGSNPSDLSRDQELSLRSWLADGLEKVVPDFLSGPQKVEGAIYHLTDTFWVEPALQKAKNEIELVYDSHLLYGGKGKPKKPSPNQKAIDTLKGKANIKFWPRDKTSSMHDKFLVRVGDGDRGEKVLCGSANFTPAGFSSQANLLHTFDNQDLATLFLARKRLLQGNPRLNLTAQNADWSKPIQVGNASIRVFFSPEPEGKEVSIETVRQKIKDASSSVVFCLYDPTDVPLLDACFAVGDSGKMMFGLVNHIRSQDPETHPGKRVLPAEIAIYHRSRKNKDVVDAQSYGNDTPQGFLKELQTFPGEDNTEYAPVIIHHKFIVIDGETESPLIYSGSANMSENSVHHNDEALLEINGIPSLAQLYLAEFMRLYENYRARAKFLNPAKSLKLKPDSGWSKKYYKENSPESRCRIALAKQQTD